MPKLILLFCLLATVLLDACASLPDKADISVENVKFAYALQGTGAPAVILEAGLGGGMDTWAPVYKEIAAFTTVFAYDRRGYGESGKPAGSPKLLGRDEISKTVAEAVLDAVVPAASTVVTLGTLAIRAADESAPRTGSVIVAELHELLRKTDVKPPYVLVGHSLGGLYTSLYARTYPQDVAGVVLADAMHPEQIKLCKQYLPPKECDPEYYPWWVKTLIRMTPGVIRAEMTGATETGRQIRAAGPLPPVPLTVISHGKPRADEPGIGQMWAALQQDLASESSRSTHIVAHRSGHNIQGDEPELVIEAIRELVMQVRQGAAIRQ